MPIVDHRRMTAAGPVLMRMTRVSLVTFVRLVLHLAPVTKADWANSWSTVAASTEQPADAV